MALSINDYERLIEAGFIDSEIQAFSESKDPSGHDQPPINLNEPVWQQTMQTRRNWIDSMRDQGYEEEYIMVMIRDYYRRSKKRSPWDFIKSEYPKVVGKKVDFQTAMAKRRTKGLNKIVRRDY